MTASEARQLLSPADAAAYLRVALQTLSRWRTQGNGPVFRKLGGLVRYDIEDLNAFLDAARRASTSDRPAR